MKVLETDAAKHLTYLFDEGRRLDWMGVAGDSTSRWLTAPELMSMESELNLNAPYSPLYIKEPRLARECFLYCGHGHGVPTDQDHSHTLINLVVFQVNDTGDQFRVLWELEPGNHPPMELAIHLTAHAAHSMGPGCVVFHCQPIHTVALAAVVGNDEKKFFESLLSGFAAVHNMLPDGIGMIPWVMPEPLRQGAPMSERQIMDMASFVSKIREHIRYQECLVLLGEGVLCASRSEWSVHSIINAVERAATIRLQMLLAGAK
jgi:rhamnulose-1-phosphate aldolase